MIVWVINKENVNKYDREVGGKFLPKYFFTHLLAITLPCINQSYPYHVNSSGHYLMEYMWLSLVSKSFYVHSTQFQINAL